MNILFGTYPFAFFTPGGGEIQLLQYKKFLSMHERLNVQLFNQWNPRLDLFSRAHFFSCMPGSFPFLKSLKDSGMPLIVSPNLWITKHTKHLYPWQEVEAQLSCFDRIICNSDMECDALSSVFDIDRSRFSTVYNGVEKSFFTTSDPNIFRHKFSINSNYVLNVANIEQRKNQLNFLKALKNFPDLQLITIGYVRDYEYLDACIKEGGHQFRYLGPLPHDSEELKSAYVGCEFFALPSTLETPGLAALEAAASGAKLLITSEGSTREYFKDFPEYVDPFDVRSISSSISILRDTPKSNDLKEYISQNFTWDRVIKALISIYENKEIFEAVDINSAGMYLSEYQDDQWFAWSKLEASFKLRAGILAFEWRAVDASKVDIYIDGALFKEGVQVNQSWAPFHIDASHLLGEVEVIFKINLLGPKSSHDPRDLGVAFKNLRWSRIENCN